VDELVAAIDSGPYAGREPAGLAARGRGSGGPEAGGREAWSPPRLARLDAAGTAAGAIAPHSDGHDIPAS
jgi:hypothetical protein